MKKTKLVTTLALSAIVLGGLAPATLAATEKKAPTKGKVEFKTVDDGDEGTVTKPDTEEEIIDPEGGGSTTGPLRMTYVPDFDFGKVEIQTATVEAPAKFNLFKETDAAGLPVGDYKEIAHFVQIEDIRGIKADWELRVSSSKFVPAKAENKPLANSHIILKEGKLFNTANQSTVADRVEALPADSVLSNDDTQSILVMKTKTGQHTDSSKTSLVFNNSYTANDVVGGVPAPGVGKDRLNPGVKLKAVGTDEKAVDDTYTATLTWTLTSGV